VHAASANSALFLPRVSHFCFEFSLGWGAKAPQPPQREIEEKREKRTRSCTCCANLARCARCWSKHLILHPRTRRPPTAPCFSLKSLSFFWVLVGSGGRQGALAAL